MNKIKLYNELMAEGYSKSQIAQAIRNLLSKGLIERIANKPIK